MRVEEQWVSHGYQEAPEGWGMTSAGSGRGNPLEGKIGLVPFPLRG